MSLSLPFTSEPIDALIGVSTISMLCSQSGHGTNGVSSEQVYEAQGQRQWLYMATAQSLHKQMGYRHFNSSTSSWHKFGIEVDISSNMNGILKIAFNLIQDVLADSTDKDGAHIFKTT